nr:NA polymerase beta subunit protein b [Dictyochloris fragrans]
MGQNILIAYMPWEGYNYEDAILISERLVYDDLYTSIHIERYETEVRDSQFGKEQITKQIPDVNKNELNHLDKNGIAKVGTLVEEGHILVGKITPINKKSQSTYQKLLYTILEKEFLPARDSSLRAPKGINAKVIDVQILIKNLKTNINLTKKLEKNTAQIDCVHIYLAEKRKIKVGDKMAGRHGNKGIVSQILPRQDMPYLPDGTPIDMVLNPLGVPSRMNVGQIYECLLGLAGKYLGECFKITPFDEIYGAEASRSLAYSKLYKARKITGINWLFNPNHPGKIRLYDGRTGECFNQAVTVGLAYMLKLVHLVDNKIHARSTGPYSLVNQQPLRGRSKYGGQRLGEMEVWALEGYGAAFTLLELLTIKSDDLTGRMTLWSNILLHKEIYIGTPESFKVLICELQALCLDIGLFRLDSKGILKQVEHLIKLP